MQSSYPAVFERDVGCTEAAWQAMLPAALGTCTWQRQGNTVCADIPPGTLTLSWDVLPERVIALVRLPRLGVRFAFTGLDAGQRHTFMKRFDLYTQRGGG